MSNRAERRRAQKELARFQSTGRMPSSAAALNDLKARQQPDPNIERLVACALIDTDGETHHGGQSHYELRDLLGLPNDPGLTLGFWTSNNRFVTRDEAQFIGEAAGQCRAQRRELLSSDIDW